MRNYITLAFKALICLFLTQIMACSTIKEIPVERIVYNYKDSTIFHVDTMYYQVPIEVIRDVVPQYDTLTLETSVAKSVSYVDTLTHSLKGSLENKDIQLQKEYITTERIVYQDRVEEKIVEKPVEVIKTKIPKLFWYLLTYCILSLILLSMYIYNNIIK